MPVNPALGEDVETTGLFSKNCPARLSTYIMLGFSEKTLVSKKIIIIKRLISDLHLCMYPHTQRDTHMNNYTHTPYPDHYMYYSYLIIVTIL